MAGTEENPRKHFKGISWQTSDNAKELRTVQNLSADDSASKYPPIQKENGKPPGLSADESDVLFT